MTARLARLGIPRCLLVQVGALILWGAAELPNAQAQIVTDGKLGSAGALKGPNYNITSGLGRTRGNNLFHSFSQFNLSAGESANFSGPANIQNILARVTGGSASSINGKISSDISGANLFLINPNGIVFGPNASVDVSGAFAASTANYLKLADGARFVASLDADDSSLSSAPVSAFGFLGETFGGISIEQSTLAVGAGNTFSLIGGDISLDGATVQAEGGRIHVASVRSAGEVPHQIEASALADLPQWGGITLQNGAQLDASGEGGGRIVIRGGRLVVEGAKISANTTGSLDGQGIDVAVTGDVMLLNGGQMNSATTAGLGSGGNISISAETVRLDGGGLVDENFVPITQISTATGDLFSGGGDGRGGDISVRAQTVEVANSAQILAASFGAGNAGTIQIEALSVQLDALFTTVAQISANTQQIEGGGNAGDILIRADRLELRNGATMVATSFGSGAAGRIDISADTMSVKSGSIVTAGAFGSGMGGNVQIDVDTLRIDGRLPDGTDSLTGIQAVTTSLDVPSPGGNIQIEADVMELSHLGTVFTTSYGIGPGGNIDLNVGTLKLSSGSTIRAEGLDAGPAGRIVVRASRDIILIGKSGISTSALLSSGGDISLSARGDVRLSDSSITASAGPGGGGNIELLGAYLGYFLNSTFSAEAAGDGGNLSVDPVFFVLNGSSMISRSSSANGGNIYILADYFFQSGSTIDASAPFGIPGTVSVTAPDLDLSGSLVSLPGSLLDLENQLRPDCRVRVSEGTSTFIMLGRGGLPLQPGGFIPSGRP